MIITAQFLGSLFEPPFAFEVVSILLGVVHVVTALALGTVVFLLTMFCAGIRL